MIIKKFILFTALSFIFIQISSIEAATEKKGIISKNERWTKEESPYIITDDILITPMARVVITPGVKILVGKPIAYVPGIKQIDNLDSFSVAITVQGSFKCVGRIDNRITFSSLHADSQHCQWYGIVLDNDLENEIEMAFVDVAEACNGITINKGAPLLRNCLLEYNNTGFVLKNNSKPQIYNSIISSNITAGIFIDKSNPTILNSIIAFNRNIGIWSDGISSTTLNNNCIFGNGDKNLYKTDPRYGILTKVNHKKDSIDFASNIFQDPIFAGSPSDSAAIENDLSLQTDKSRIIDTTIAKMVSDTLKDYQAIKVREKNYKRFSLSPYSPCNNSGKKGKPFSNLDGSRNSMGIYGGQEFGDF